MKKIAIIGAPGSGKTTIASGIFYNLKIRNIKTEIVPELIKYKVYSKSSFSEDGFDIQNTIEQRNLELTICSTDLDFVICEAPLCNGYFYSSYYKKNDEWPFLKKIAKKYIDSYDFIFFVEHLDNSFYESFGRKESKDESLNLQNHILEKIKELTSHKIIKINQLTKLEDIISIILNP